MDVKQFTRHPELIGERPEFWKEITVHHDSRDRWTHLEPLPKPWHCVLYRIYGDDSELLYVGTSLHPNQRLVYHRRKKDWWEEVRRIELWLTRDTADFDTGWWRDHHLREHTARAWESLCVTTQRPTHNKTSRG